MKYDGRQHKVAITAYERVGVRLGVYRTHVLWNMTLACGHVRTTMSGWEGTGYGARVINGKSYLCVATRLHCLTCRAQAQAREGLERARQQV